MIEGTTYGVEEQHELVVWYRKLRTRAARRSVETVTNTLLCQTKRRLTPSTSCFLSLSEALSYWEWPGNWAVPRCDRLSVSWIPATAYDLIGGSSRKCHLIEGYPCAGTSNLGRNEVDVWRYGNVQDPETCTTITERSGAPRTDHWPKMRLQSIDFIFMLLLVHIFRPARKSACQYSIVNSFLSPITSCSITDKNSARFQIS